MKRRKRVTYRPGKTSGVFGAVAGGIFCLIGLFVVIPTFGPFGILWTLFAAAITFMNLYQSFGKGYRGPEVYIEDEETESASQPVPQPASSGPEPAGDNSAKTRLEQLQALYDGGLITRAEYEEKRRDILNDL